MTVSILGKPIFPEQYVVWKCSSQQLRKFPNCDIVFEHPGRISLHPIPISQIFRFHFVDSGISSNHDKLLFCTQTLT